MNSDIDSDTEISRQLPASFWGEPVAATDNAPLPVADPSTADSIQWAPSFELLGYEFHDAMAKCVNTDSAILRKQLHTIEDVYLHLKGVKELQDANEIGMVSSTIVKRNTAAIKAASDEWHEACAQRKAAIIQWDAYVAAKREALRTIRKEHGG